MIRNSCFIIYLLMGNMTRELKPSLLHRFCFIKDTFTLVTSKSTDWMKSFTPMELVATAMRTRKPDSCVWFRHVPPPKKTMSIVSLPYNLSICYSITHISARVYKGIRLCVEGYSILLRILSSSLLQPYSAHLYGITVGLCSMHITI